MPSPYPNPRPAAAGLSSADPRVRRIPFATQRPTFSESRRVVGLLVSVFEPSAGFLAAEQVGSMWCVYVSMRGRCRKSVRRHYSQQIAQLRCSLCCGAPGVYT